jgi:hypothetical protein
MNADPLLAAALRHWGARSVPFTESPGSNPFLSPAWEQALRLLNQTAALRSLMLLVGDNGAGKTALVAYWLERLEPKAYLPLVITHATLSASGLLAVLLRKLGQPASLIRSRNLARLEDALKELGRLTPTWASIWPANPPSLWCWWETSICRTLCACNNTRPFTPASAPTASCLFWIAPKLNLI